MPAFDSCIFILRAHKIDKYDKYLTIFTYYLFIIHSSLEFLSRFFLLKSNGKSEEVKYKLAKFKTVDSLRRKR